MPFKPLSSIDFLTVLHESRSIWSAGLKPDEYCEYNEMQRNDIWGHRNQELWAYETDEGELAASLKLYKLTMTSRQIEYPCYGVGAIYSRQQFRGQGYGGQIVEALIDKAQADKQAAILLFSDIGTEFYSQYGFHEIGTIEFSVPVQVGQLDKKKLASVKYKVTPLAKANLEEMERHHRRWLSRRPFGVSRSLDYFRYKARKEDYLNQHSRLPWPKLHVITVHGDDNGTKFGAGSGHKTDMSYAIYEVAGDNFRVLELITSKALVEKIWQAIFAEAARHKAKRIKSWESNILELAPAYSLKSFFRSTVYKPQFAPTIYYSQRSWGKVMILPLENEVLPWLRSFPSPILELDHL